MLGRPDLGPPRAREVMAEMEPIPGEIPFRKPRGGSGCGCLVAAGAGLVLFSMVVLCVGDPGPARDPVSSPVRPEEAGLTPAERREMAHLRRLMDAERAVERCLAVMVAPCDCSPQAVSFVRVMQGESRMSMTRRRRLDASRDLAAACMAVEEGIDLDDWLRRNP